MALPDKVANIVERLRAYEAVGGLPLPRLCGEAADEIDRLTALFDKWHTIAAEKHAEIERLRAALEEYGDHKYECTMKDTSECSCGYTAVLTADKRDV